MKKEDIILCENDTKFIKITYRSTHNMGAIVMKKQFYELKIKSITRLLKGCEYYVIDPYIPLLPELIDMDGDIQHLKARIRFKENYLKQWNDYIDEKEKHDILDSITCLEQEIAECVDRIVKRREVNDHS